MVRCRICCCRIRGVAVGTAPITGTGLEAASSSLVSDFGCGWGILAFFYLFLNFFICFKKWSRTTAFCFVCLDHGKEWPSPGPELEELAPVPCASLPWWPGQGQSSSLCKTGVSPHCSEFPLTSDDCFKPKHMHLFSYLGDVPGQVPAFPGGHCR